VHTGNTGICFRLTEVYLTKYVFSLSHAAPLLTTGPRVSPMALEAKNTEALGNVFLFNVLRRLVAGSAGRRKAAGLRIRPNLAPPILGKPTILHTDDLCHNFNAFRTVRRDLLPYLAVQLP